jgi:Serine-pyruvate aminotransferase/archaeal aspartate aminotransferase
MADRILMHVGPSRGNIEVAESAAVHDQGFSSSEFSEKMRLTLKGILEISGAVSGYSPFVIPGSGTAAMESLTTFLSPGDNVLVLSHGTFGDRWKGIFSRYPVNVRSLRSAPGKHLKIDDIRKAASDQHYRMAIMTHVETSTGLRADLEAIIDSVRQSADIIVVDSVASLGGERLELSKLGIDVTVSASQKAIGAAPGAGIIVASNDAIEKIRDGGLSGYFLNLSNWRPVMEKFLDGSWGYFATPPIGVVYTMARALEMIRREGMESRLKRHSRLASLLRDGIEDMCLSIVAEPQYRSNTVTGVYVNGIDSSEFIRKCLKSGVEFADGALPELKGKYFRIGHMGWVQEQDIIRSLDAIRKTLSEIK